jgi:hypothetical protein
MSACMRRPPRTKKRRSTPFPGGGRRGGAALLVAASPPPHLKVVHFSSCPCGVGFYCLSGLMQRLIQSTRALAAPRHALCGSRASVSPVSFRPPAVLSPRKPPRPSRRPLPTPTLSTVRRAAVGWRRNDRKKEQLGRGACAYQAPRFGLRPAPGARARAGFMPPLDHDVAMWRRSRSTT